MLTSAQITAMTTAQFHSLTTDQVHAITTDQIAGLETRDMLAMTDSQLLALASDTISAMSDAQFNTLLSVTPIALDLDGHGVNTLSATNGVNFDLLGTGQVNKVGWVAGGDGLLVMDRNHDGIINNGSELFGMGTILANGKRAHDGYAALAEQDTNHDGKINSHDAHWKELKVWVDANHDGKTDAGELKTLEELGVASLSLAAQKSELVDHGNLIGLISSYTTTDGKEHQMADVWFAKDVQPQSTETKATVSLTDVLAPATAAVPGTEHVDQAKAADAASSTAAVAATTDAATTAAAASPTVDHHLAAIDRKLVEEEELRKAAGNIWL